ncbi:MAG: amino acid ABC transporter permease [Lachnospiraceae bacterium]
MKKIIQFFFKPVKGKTPLIRVIVNFLLATGALVAFFWFSLYLVGVKLNFQFIVEFRMRIWKGFLLTMCLSAVSLLVSLTIGVLSAMGQESRFLLLRYLSRIYVTFIRGTPLIVQIYLFFYIVGTAWGIENRFLAGVLILSLFEGAYIAEIVRGSLITLDKTQLEAARAVGFNPSQTVRFVILPQMIACTLPGLTGQFASIIKDSSLLSMIAVIELTQTMREISASNYKLFECYFFLGLLYLCLTLPVSFISQQLERRFGYEH